MTSVPDARSAQEEPGPRLFAAHALALRADGIAGGEAVASLRTGMPGAAGLGAAGEVKAGISPLWRPFFENAVVRLGRLDSASPVALHYNPLLDVALFTRWEAKQTGYRVALARALPG